MDDIMGDELALHRVEVRVLGPLRARRADGSLVDAKEWRTGQTADLLRLLALSADEPVPVDVLLEALWPNVDEGRGRASLRTAASRVRKVLGVDCVERRLGGLLLRDAWVDAQAFRTLAREARRHVLTGAAAAVVTTTREAESLYLSELQWSSGGGEWAVRARESLAATYRQLVADAADAAAGLGWWNDALDFAERSLALEPASERASRAAMRAHRGLGEMSRALQVYERCRRTLSDEFGADPSPETQALWGELLRDDPQEREAPPFCGHGAELRWLADVVGSAASSATPVVSCIVGPRGAGKTQLVRQALPGAVSATADWAKALADAAPGRPVVLEGVDALPPEERHALAESLAGLTGAVAVVVTGRPQHGAVEELVRVLGDPSWAGSGYLLHLPPLEEHEVAGLCVALLGGPVSERLTRAVLDEVGGWPGPVIELVRAWAAGGRVTATTEGLVLVQPHSAASLHGHVRSVLAAAVDSLSGDELELLHLVAVLDRPVAPDALLPLLSDDDAAPAEGQRALLGKVLDQLVDRSLVTASGDGFTVRDPLLRDALVAWLRPSALRRLHRRIAERAVIPPVQRIGHWREAGEPQLAQAAVLDASAEALAEGRYDQALPHLRSLLPRTEREDSAPADRVSVLEQVGDACRALGRTPEASATYAAAAEVARAHALGDLDRLEGKLRGAAEGTRIREGVDEQARRVGDALSPDAAVGVSRDAAPDPEVELRLSEAVRAADAADDGARGAALRLLLSDVVCTPRRQLRATHRWTSEASAVRDPGVQARALASAWLPGVVLGNAAAAEAPLRRAAELAATAGARRTGARVAALRFLVATDLGRSDRQVRLVAANEAGAFCAGSPDAWVLQRVSAERGEVALAAALAAAPQPQCVPPVLRQLQSLSAAALALAVDQPDVARARLLEVVDVADETGATLLVPEAAARLVALEAPFDLSRAHERFELFEWAVRGDRLLPRESVLRHLARAAIRAADDRPGDAASAAASAAEAAEAAGLALLSAEAHEQRAVHLAAAGRRPESRLAAAAAASAYVRAGADALARRAQDSARPRPGAGVVVAVGDRPHELHLVGDVVGGA